MKYYKKKIKIQWSRALIICCRDFMFRSVHISCHLWCFQSECQAEVLGLLGFPCQVLGMGMKPSLVSCFLAFNCVNQGGDVWLQCKVLRGVDSEDYMILRSQQHGDKTLNHRQLLTWDYLQLCSVVQCSCRGSFLKFVQPTMPTASCHDCRRW